MVLILFLIYIDDLLKGSFAEKATSDTGDIAHSYSHPFLDYFYDSTMTDILK